MRYHVARRQVRSGDLLAWEGSGLAAALVRWWTRSRWSHVGVAVWLGGRLFVLEAFPLRGVRLRPLSQALPVYWVPAPGVKWRKARTWALQELGIRYSFAECLRVAFGLRPGRLGWQCAEYARELLGRAGVPLGDVFTPDRVVAAVEARSGLKAQPLNL